MLNIQIQGGDKKSGWRYSPREGQSKLLDLLIAKLPHYVVEVNSRAVWWRVFNPEAEQLFLADVAKVTRNFKIETGGSHNPEDTLENPYVGGDALEFIDDLVKDYESSRQRYSSDEAINQIVSITGCSAKRCEVLGANEEFTLIKTPPIQGDDYIPSKVYKISLYDLEYKEVWDCGKTKLGRLLKEKLIREELG